MIVYTILVALLVIFWPSDAFAWGPGTHLETAKVLLEGAVSFSPIVIPLMKAYRDEFIYGMVSADLLVGKKYAGYLHHCHNWDIAWKILDGCKSDRERASAYGYLTHLAADIVAHNYYIPYMIIKSFDANNVVNHTYWELRFDIHVKRSTWNEVKRIVDGDFSCFDHLLEETLIRPLFSFKTNKRIFSTILLLQQFKKLRKTIEIQSKFSEWPLTEVEVEHYRSLIMELAREFLTIFKDAKCLQGEPAGLKRLKYASNLRKSLKRMVSRGMVEKEDVKEFVERLKIKLKDTMLEPDASLPESYEAL